MKKMILLLIFSLLVAFAILMYQNYAIVSIGGMNYLLRTNVKNFENISDYPVDYLSSLKRFSKLEKLRIWADDNFQLSCLDRMDNLSNITVFYRYPYSYSPQSLSGLDSLKNLKELGIIGWYDNVFTVLDTDGINYSNIEKLEIHNQRSVDFNSISCFDNLYILDIDVYELKVSDLECLSDLKNLESISITTFIRDVDLSRLEGCQSLKCISIINRNENGYYLKDSSCFENLDGVVELTLGYIYIDDISGIMQMDSLKVLHINDKCLSNEQIIELENKGIEVDIL